jgi:hypothetical protein
MTRENDAALFDQETKQRIGQAISSAVWQRQSQSPTALNHIAGRVRRRQDGTLRSKLGREAWPSKEPAPTPIAPTRDSSQLKTACAHRVIATTNSD